MIGWLQSVDVWLFRLINVSWSNRFFDGLMPFLSDSSWLTCLVLLLALGLLVKGGARGRLCVLMLALALCLGNAVVCDSLKHGIGRLRPFHVVSDARLRVGMGGSFSMPSSHAANWFSATLILFVYYRRSIWCLLPLASMVGLSRIYNGVHYPGDVMAGALLGMGYSAAILWGADALWQWIGPRWFPVWWERMPSLLSPVARDGKEGLGLGLRLGTESEKQNEGEAKGETASDGQWLRLGYALIALIFLGRLAYIGWGGIELSEDEAYQWLWSKHPALSYYSKPPMIAYTQWLGTHLWGDTEFGVRFFSAAIAAVLSLVVLRLVARQSGGRVSFVLFLVLTFTPLLAVGSTLMTVDPLSVMFWTAALAAGWRAVQPDSTTTPWLWVGLWTGLGCLSKWTNLLQPLCWAVFFLLWPAARRHLRRPGPWLALLIAALFCLPALVWMQQHQWITLEHVASNGQLEKAWTRTYVAPFLEEEAGLLHPFFFVAAVWAALAFWRQGRRDPFQLFLFSMGAPLFFGCFLLSFHSHVLGNWIAPSVIPLFCLMAVYWSQRWERNAAVLRPLLATGIALGLVMIAIVYDPNLVNKVLHRRLPPKLDPLRRVHGWKETARIAGQARCELAAEGLPTFIIGEHYGITSQISFYLAAAKRQVNAEPLVYFCTSARPQNQFFYWPDYLHRTGQNALFVREVSRPALRPDWLGRWWRHEPDIFLPDDPRGGPPPPEIRNQFDSFTDLGVRDVLFDGNIVRRVQLIQCRHLH